MAEGGQSRIDRAELKVAQPVGIFEDIERTGSVQIGQRDAPVLDQVVAILEPGIVRPAANADLFVAAEGDVPSVGADRRSAPGEGEVVRKSACPATRSS